MRRLNSADGAVLLIALMAMMLMMALATALMMTTITETKIASSYDAGVEAFYAADAAIERAIDDLRTIPDWSGLAGQAAISTLSTFVDGAPGGARTLWDGTTLDLGEETRLVREGDSSSWRLFAYGALGNILPPPRLMSRAYVVVWLADSPDPPSQPDEEAVGLLAQAYGPQGVRRSVRVVLARKTIHESKGIVVVSWHEGP